MDFFASQDLARRKTRQMVVLLLLSLAATIAGVYLIIVVAINVGIESGDKGGIPWFEPLLFVGVAAAVSLLVGGGSLYKVSQLRSGGGAGVATLLGGRRLLPNSKDRDERKLLNIVEEMAIASGTPVPPVYLLEKEGSINAFAAGFTPSDAVIGVNRGTIEQLNRDELQGVIAHEFSHILNGDMRMSLRMIGLLHGIQLIALIGYFVLRAFGTSSSRSSSKDKGGGQAVILLIGVGLLVVGSIGLFFARLIKASVSRQREYLADASAVQFTRNPEGIGGALKMIGATPLTSKIEAPNAEVASHMYFASMFGSLRSSLMSTHPPLVDRIRRIDPRFDGSFAETARIRKRRLERLKEFADEPEAETPRTKLGIPGRGWLPAEMQGRFPVDPALIIAGIGLPTEEDVLYSQLLVKQAPPHLTDAVRDLFSARAVALAMLLDTDESVRKRQLVLIEQREGKPTQVETQRLEPTIRSLSPALRLPMVEILQGTLAGLSKPQFETFRGTIQAMSDADAKISLFELFIRLQLIEHLDRQFGKTPPPRSTYHSIHPVADDLSVVLSLLVRSGARDSGAAQSAFQTAVQSAFGSAAPALRLVEPAGADRVSNALRRLALTTPPIRKKIVTAAATAIAHDGQITIEEAELFRAISESLGCPVPPIVATAGKTSGSAAPPPLADKVSNQDSA